MEGEPWRTTTRGEALTFGPKRRRRRRHGQNGRRFLPTPDLGFGISNRVCVPPFQWTVNVGDLSQKVPDPALIEPTVADDLHRDMATGPKLHRLVYGSHTTVTECPQDLVAGDRGKFILRSARGLCGKRDSCILVGSRRGLDGELDRSKTGVSPGSKE